MGGRRLDLVSVALANVIKNIVQHPADYDAKVVAVGGRAKP